MTRRPHLPEAWNALLHRAQTPSSEISPLENDGCDIQLPVPGLGMSFHSESTLERGVQHTLAAERVV
jgi:hypothetical protein